MIYREETMFFVHTDVEPLKAFVREDVLYDMDLDKANNYIKCMIIGMSSYQGSVPTFQIVVAGGSIFSYVPPHLLIVDKKPEGEELFDLSDLVYHNCPDSEFALVMLDYLCDKPVMVFLKNRKIWVKSKYLFTVDWYRGNDLLNCVVLENNQIGFFPNHKISLGECNLPKYKKLRQEWKV